MLLIICISMPGADRFSYTVNMVEFDRRTIFFLSQQRAYRKLAIGAREKTWLGYVSMLKEGVLKVGH